MLESVAFSSVMYSISESDAVAEELSLLEQAARTNTMDRTITIHSIMLISFFITNTSTIYNSYLIIYFQKTKGKVQYQRRISCITAEKSADSHGGTKRDVSKAMEQENRKNRIELSPALITDLFVYVMLAGLPLWFDKGGYTNLTTSKFIFFAVTTGIWAMLTAVSAIRREEKIRMTSDKWIVILFVIFAGLSALFSPFQEHVWMGSGRYNGYVTLLMYALLFLGVSSYGTMKSSYPVVFICSLAVCSVVAVLQLLGQNPFHLYPGDWNYYDKGIYYSSEFLGNVGNVDLFGALLCAGIPMAAAQALLGKKKSSVLLMIPTGLCLFVGLVMDVAALKLGLLGAFVVLFILCFRHRQSLQKGKTVLVIAILIISVVSISTLTFREGSVSFRWRQDEAAETAAESEPGDWDMIKNGDWEKAGSSRLGIWKKLLETVPEYPWLGSGPGTVADRADMVFERYVPETGNTLKARVDNAHNEYLEFLVCEGLIGLCLYLLLIMITIRRCRKEKDLQKIILIPALTGYWIQSFFGLGLILVLPVVYIFWALCASERK